MWPRQDRYRHLGDVVDLANAAPLSARATGGFHSRAERSTLRMRDEFRRDVALHARLMAEHSAAQSASGDIELERRTSGPPLGVHVKGLAIA